MSILKPSCAIAALTLAASPAAADHLTYYTAALNELNNSGVSGSANLTLDSIENSLRVQINATGLEPGMVHVQHIHGLVGPDGPLDSVTPPDSADDPPNGDGDTFVEVNEGAPFYGPILLGLSNPPGGALVDFPTAPDGNINYDVTFDLDDDAIFAGDFDVNDLLPLALREIVIHGSTVPAGVNPDLPDGGYLATLPVAAGEIAIVPTPSAAAAGLAAISLVAFRRRRQAA